MSIQVKLFVDDNEFIVEQHYFSFFQNADQTGRPTSKPMNRTFDFVIHGSNDTTFFEWSIDSQMMKNCKITFSSRFGTSKSNTIELLDTYCLYYKLHYQHDSSSPMMVYFSLSPATILFNGQEMLSHWWRKTDPALLGQPVIEREDEDTEPKVIDYYITDLEGNKKPEYEVGDQVYVVVKTKNMTGKELTLNLKDKTKDFKYEGEVLPNDRLENYQIRSNTEKIKLEVIPQQN
ncbi:type VI secretion system tube protein TssD [Aquimarina sp. BL5]|uniref:type VI secretion system tube protein TssD n=1 Tax=Aquimarina sp. BL5 TaxID=1714860 RepID=UPI000EA9C254|nr:type VI secretion system tube protein TssD [Aquimarina sp. BL5]